MQTELAQKLAMPTTRTESWIFYGVLIGARLPGSVVPLPASLARSW
jgi:hypothetical protein